MFSSLFLRIKAINLLTRGVVKIYSIVSKMQNSYSYRTPKPVDQDFIMIGSHELIGDIIRLNVYIPLRRVYFFKKSVSSVRFSDYIRPLNIEALWPNRKRYYGLIIGAGYNSKDFIYKDHSEYLFVLFEKEIFILERTPIMEKYIIKQKTD